MDIMIVTTARIVDISGYARRKRDEMSINITELDVSLTLRNFSKEEKQAVVRLMELAIEETKAAMQARIEKLTEYPERLQKAITELEAMVASPAFTEKARILGKIEGLKLALGYFEEMNK